MLRPLAILLLAAPLAFAAPVPKESKESKATDEAKILGTWEMVCYGQEQALNRPVSWRLEADG